MTYSGRCPWCRLWHTGRRGQSHEDCYVRDDRAVAYYTGAADARNHRPRRVDHADTSIIGDAYSRGYKAQRIASAAHWLSLLPKAAVYPQDRR